MMVPIMLIIVRVPNVLMILSLCIYIVMFLYIQNTAEKSSHIIITYCSISWSAAADDACADIIVLLYTFGMLYYYDGNLCSCKPVNMLAVYGKSYMHVVDLDLQLSAASAVKTLIHTRNYRGGYCTVWTKTLRTSVNARRIVKVKVNRESESWTRKVKREREREKWMAAFGFRNFCLHMQHLVTNKFILALIFSFQKFQRFITRGPEGIIHTRID